MLVQQFATQLAEAFFLALGVGPGRTSLDRDEFVEPVRLRLSDVLARVRTGEIVDAKTICTVLYAAVFVCGGLR